MSMSLKEIQLYDTFVYDKYEIYYTDELLKLEFYY